MNQCPKKTNVIQLSLDGVQESRSTSVSNDVYSISFDNCKSVFPVRIIRPINRHKYNEKFHLNEVLSDIYENNLKISDIIGDKPKRSFFRCAKGHNSTNACEYCESPAVHKKDKKAIDLVKKICLTT